MFTYLYNGLGDLNTEMVGLIQTWGHEQPHKAERQIPENQDDILRHMFVWNQIINIKYLCANDTIL
jgi:hypothetical protein